MKLQMFEVSEKATEIIKEILGNREDVSPIRIMLVAAD
jgi:hypothetical protein